MHPLFLLASAGLIFFLAYRYYAGFIASTGFPTDALPQPPALRRGDEGEFSAAFLPALLAWYFAVLCGGSTIAGVALASTFGYAPVTLWVVALSALVAGTFGMGILWLSLRASGEGVHYLASLVLDPKSSFAFFFLGLLVLLTLLGVLALLIGETIFRHPQASWSLLCFFPAAFAHGRRAGRPAGWYRYLLLAVAVALPAAALVLGIAAPLRLDGALILDLGETLLVGVNPAGLWATLAVGLTLWAAGLPPSLLSRPHGVFAGGALAMLLLTVLIAVAFDAPPITAPEFHRPADSAPALFMLNLVVGGGAFAGYQALLLAGPVARQIADARHVKPVAFGGALAVGFFAIMVVIVIAYWSAQAQGGTFAWTESALQAPIPQWLDLFLLGAAAALTRIGLPPEWAVTLWSMTLVALMLATLEAGLRALKLMTADFQQAFALRVLRGARPVRVAATAVLVVLWIMAQRPLDTDTWMAFGTLNHWLALACLALLAVALRRGGRSSAPVMYPLSALLALQLWSGAYAIWRWAGAGKWLPLAVSLAGLLLAGLTLFAAAKAAYAPHRAKRPPAA
jgi:carbon starvation protein